MKVKCLRSYEEALSEVERELNVRSRCFPGWIKDGRVNRVDAQDRLDRLATAFTILNAMTESQQHEWNLQRMKGAASEVP